MKHTKSLVLCFLTFFSINIYAGNLFDDFINENYFADKSALGNRNHDYDEGEIAYLTQLKTQRFYSSIHADNNIDVLADSLQNNKFSAACVATNNHAKALVGYKKDSGELLFVYADPYGAAISPSLKQKLEGNGEVIDLTIQKQSDGNSCGAYAVEFITAIIDALDQGKLTKVEILSVLNQRNWNAETIRAEQYHLVNGAYPKWYQLQTEQIFPTQLSSQQITQQSQVVESKIVEFRKVLETEGSITNITQGNFIKLEEKLSVVEKQLASAQTSKITIAELNLLRQDQKVFEGAMLLYQEAQKQIMQLVLQEVSAAILSRISSVSHSQYSILGIGAGSEFEKYGLWAQGFGTTVTQKENDENDAYKSKTFGFATGLDLGYEAGLLGIAYNFASSELSFDKIQDKNLINSNINHLISLYGSVATKTNIHIITEIGGGVSSLELQDKTKRSGRIFFGFTEGRYYFDIAKRLQLFPQIGFEAFKLSYVNDTTSSKTKKISEFNMNSRGGSVVLGVGIKNIFQSGDINFAPEFSVGVNIIVFGNEEKTNIQIPHKKAGTRNNTKEKVTFFAKSKMDIATSSNLKSSIGVNYRTHKDFHSIDGYVKLSVSL
jgi:outer membrane autotransporter protein